LATRKITVANPRRTSRALLLPATRRDFYRLGDTWSGDYADWRYGLTVPEIRHFGQETYSVGDTLEVYDFQNRLGVRADVTGIKMLVCADITDEDIALLGYRDRAEWLEQTEGGLGGRRAWMFLLQNVRHFDATGQIATSAAEVQISDTEKGATEHLHIDLRDSDKKH
jgi:hypothetical protein